MTQYFNKVVQFFRKHPILFHLLLIVVTFSIVTWLILVYLDFWTSHGKESVVPDVKGMNYERASEVLTAGGFAVVLNDSVYADSAQPGEVIDQSPRGDDHVKPGRTVYLTINALYAKPVTVPNVTGMSLRQAQAELMACGLKHIDVRYVESEYKDLTLGLRYNGVPLRSGTRIPITASVTLEVGRGMIIEPEFDALSNSGFTNKAAADHDENQIDPIFE